MDTTVSQAARDALEKPALWVLQAPVAMLGRLRTLALLDALGKRVLQVLQEHRASQDSLIRAAQAFEGSRGIWGFPGFPEFRLWAP